MSFQQVLKNQKQISNTYLPHNGLLSYSDYGNGGRVGYAYDKWGRTIEKNTTTRRPTGMSMTPTEVWPGKKASWIRL